MKPPPPITVNVTIVRPHRAQTILMLGILGFLFAPFGFFAMFLGKRDLRDMQAGTMDRTGEPLTNLGRMLGKISSIVWAIKWMFLMLFGLIVYWNWQYVSTWF